MTISGSLSNALSGLSAAARTAQAVSSNISNAMTDGYARREISLSARALTGTGGVWIDGTVRHSDPRHLFDRRQAQAESGANEFRSNALGNIQSAYGLPDDPNSLTALVARFENALVSASTDPSSSNRLTSLAHDAGALVNKFRSLSDTIQSEREAAESTIARHVHDLNAKLEEVRKLNVAIVTAEVTKRDSSALQDVRQKALDELSAIIPLREVARPNGAVALFTTGGAILLDGGNAAQFDFVAANTIVPHMTADNGLLSGLTLNGEAIPTGKTGPLGDGVLASAFQVRDAEMVHAQSQLDAVARNLLERFQSSSIDPTLGATDAGLFTDAGGFFTVADEIGISGRLELNALVDPDAGGQPSRLRDGINAVGAGPVGNAEILTNYRTAMTAEFIPSSGDFGGRSLTFQNLSIQIGSDSAQAFDRAESAQVYARTRLAELQSVRRQSFSESRGCIVTEALVRFLFEFRRPRLGAATGVFGLSVS